MTGRSVQWAVRYLRGRSRVAAQNQCVCSKLWIHENNLKSSEPSGSCGFDPRPPSPRLSERVAPARWKLFDSIEVFYKQVNRPD